ncbi:MAG TPA: septal ring lytic transglycosylase RlpA family protein [Solirubrobacteraceae bacterium]|nr:septal ring lytic transglycosylase RlpA family protein [Solirubrobacteraceae bacterium]
MRTVTYTLAHALALLAPALPQGGMPAQRPPQIRVRSAQLNVLRGQPATVTGTLGEAGAGDAVSLQERIGGRWRTRALTTAGVHGRFALAFRPQALGSAAVRLRATGDGSVAAFPPPGCLEACTQAAQAARLWLRARARPLGTLNVFRAVVASWYSSGGTTACGIYLTAATLGVANRTLPCGTIVTLRYGARSLRVPVIDRGPFVEGREYDLTEATKQALGFPSLGVVWSTY